MKNLDKLLELYQDVWIFMSEEYPKLPPYISFIATLSSSVGPLLAILGKKYIVELQVVYTLMKTINPQVVESWKFVLPYNYAALCGNILGTLASLCLRVLDGKERAEKTEKCVMRMLDMVSWLIAQGKISREVTLFFVLLC